VTDTQSQQGLDARVLQAAYVALVLAVACATSPVTAAVSVSGILGCRSLLDATARLACFDRESAQIAAATSAPTVQSTTPAAPIAQPSAPERLSSTKAAPPAAAADAVAAIPSVPAQAPSSPLDPKHTFGLSAEEVSAREEAAGKRPHMLASITAHIARFSAGGGGRVLFRLDNDQVWEQLLSEGDLNASPGDEVEISRGMLGSYWLKDKATARGCKVRRLR
jgi:hypothetical protein